jgi:hypothetical protein
MFKVYKRKIHVYVEGAPATAPHLKRSYVWSTNACRTCRDAVKAAKELYPTYTFTANFAKD